MRSPVSKPSETTIQTQAPSTKRYENNLDEKWNGDENAEMAVIPSSVHPAKTNSATTVSIYDTITDHLPVKIDIAARIWFPNG